MTRASNVYGAHQQLFKIIPRTAIYVRLGRTLALHGGGEQVRSFVHIRDVSHGELAVMERGGDGEVYNLSPDDSATIREIVSKVCTHAGVALEDVTESVAARTGNDAAYTIDSTKARERFGWRPRVTLDEGISEVVDWVGRDWETIRTLPLEYVHKP